MSRGIYQIKNHQIIRARENLDLEERLNFKLMLNCKVTIGIYALHIFYGSKGEESNGRFDTLVFQISPLGFDQSFIATVLFAEEVMKVLYYIRGAGFVDLLVGQYRELGNNLLEKMQKRNPDKFERLSSEPSGHDGASDLHDEPVRQSESTTSHMTMKPEHVNANSVEIDLRKDDAYKLRIKELVRKVHSLPDNLELSLYVAPDKGMFRQEGSIWIQHSYWLFTVLLKDDTKEVENWETMDCGEFEAYQRFEKHLKTLVESKNKGIGDLFMGKEVDNMEGSFDGPVDPSTTRRSRRNKLTNILNSTLLLFHSTVDDQLSPPYPLYIPEPTRPSQVLLLERYKKISKRRTPEVECENYSIRGTLSFAGPLW